MSNELVEKLLETTNEDNFLAILAEQEEDYEFNRELWDERVIDHFLKIFGITKEEFEKQFIKMPPIDDFDE